MMSKLNLYYNTLRHLKLSQIYYRLTKILKKKFLKAGTELDSIKLVNYFPRQFYVKELDFSYDYLSRFSTEDILENKFAFINVIQKIDPSKAWNNPDYSHLWRYNLHYFEYLYALADTFIRTKDERFYIKIEELIESWIYNNDNYKGDGWHPYTVSLRLTNWITIFCLLESRVNSNTKFAELLMKSIYQQYLFLISNTEKDVLGNHYFENIKALLITSIFLDDIETTHKYKKMLLRQLKMQINDDGMHFELSPMYHKIILEDLIKITIWLKDDCIYPELILYIQKMIDVAFSLENNFGKVPAFNDSANGVSKSLESLLEASKNNFDISPKIINSILPSGYYIIGDNPGKLIFDVGEICPAYLPAHGHCDALSFELSVEGKPFIVNSGTYTYERNEWRTYFRNTKAHNTLMFGEKEQAGIWGQFRVAKRISEVRSKIYKSGNLCFYIGEHTTQHGDMHRRYVCMLNELTYLIIDDVSQSANDTLKSYIHFVPKIYLYSEDDEFVARKDGKVIASISVFGSNKEYIKKSWYSESFNVKDENRLIEIQGNVNNSLIGYMITIGDKTSNNRVLLEKDHIRVSGTVSYDINYNELRKAI